MRKVFTKFILTNVFVLFFVSSIVVTAQDYESVKIGNQVWMSENLNVSHYRNGDEIPQVTDPDKWLTLTTGAWCYYNNSEYSGKLYNWYAVNDPRGLAPEGWRVGSDEDWKVLEQFLGMSKEQANIWAGSPTNDKRGTTEGSKLASGYGFWGHGGRMDSEEDYTEILKKDFDLSGFNGAPSGARYAVEEVDFDGEEDFAYWWTSAQHSPTEAVYRFLYKESASVYRFYNSKSNGYSVRCVRD